MTGAPISVYFLFLFFKSLLISGSAYMSIISLNALGQKIKLIATISVPVIAVATSAKAIHLKKLSMLPKGINLVETIASAAPAAFTKYL